MTAKKRPAKKFEKRPGWLNQSEVAASLEISTQAFKKWNVEPVSENGREKFYTMKSVLKNRLTHQEKKYTENHNPERKISQDELDHQRWRKLKEEADKLSMQNEVIRQNQGPVELLEWGLAKTTQELGSILDGISSKIKKRLPHLKAAEITIINNEINRCRNVAAEAELPWHELEDSD